MRLRDSGELEFLRAVRKAAGGAEGPVRLGIGDDAAVIAPPPGQSLVLTCDAAVEGRHFRREWFSAEEIGERAVRCAISDLAAMGARPAAALLTLIISPDEDVSMARGVVDGAARAARELGARLAGGETVGHDGPLALDVAAAGFVPQGRELRRSGARPGDVLMVSGTLGDSAAGLAALRTGLDSPPARAVIARYKRPEPRVTLGLTLAECDAVHACIDISDGLLRDAGHLAEQSGVGILIRAESLPLSDECRQVGAQLRLDPLPWALAGGEDFELLFCLRPEAASDFIGQAFEDPELRLAVIGEVVDGDGVRVVDADGAEVVSGTTGWDQFQAR
jgi:thiamine-monophosphate kinase